MKNAIKNIFIDIIYKSVGKSPKELAKEFSDPTCVIIKHATPCGIASAKNLKQAWIDAYATDNYSPFVE